MKTTSRAALGGLLAVACLLTGLATTAQPASAHTHHTVDAPTEGNEGRVHFFSYGEYFQISDHKADGYGVTARFKWCETCPAYVAGHNGSGAYSETVEVDWNWDENETIYVQACLSNGGTAPFHRCGIWWKSHT